MEAFLKDMEEKMQKTIEFTRKDFTTIRTGRATPAVLDRITVDSYGQNMPLKQVASISVPDPRSLLIQPWDRSLAGEIEKALQKADLGINPMNDGKVIRLNFPPLSEERRKDLVKVIKKKGEENKVSLRNLRRETLELLKNMKKDGQITEDDLKLFEEQVQKITDKYAVEIDKTIEAKEKEIMEV